MLSYHPQVYVVRDIVTKHQNLEIGTLRYLLEKKCIFCFFQPRRKTFQVRREMKIKAPQFKEKERFHLIFTKLFLE